MDRTSYVLAAFAANDLKPFTPVQIQKFFFLAERLIGEDIGYEPRFAFQPYHYGPFDKAIYDALDSLVEQGLVEVTQFGEKRRLYSISNEGRTAANFALGNVQTNVADKLRELSKFVTSLSFRDLVSVIYRDYPEMRVNSVFRSE
jgi:uncharacterized protein